MYNMKPNINLKTVTGVGVGVSLGFFVFKSKNPLVLMLLGIAGGVVATKYISKGDKIKDAEKQVSDYTQEVTEDIEESISDNVDAVNETETTDRNPSDETMGFNKNVGYITPKGTVHEQNPSEYMDIEF